jgi:hypothetical protein
VAGDAPRSRGSAACDRFVTKTSEIRSAGLVNRQGKIPHVIASRFRRPVAASLLMAATVFAALLPPSHIHLAEHDDHDHDHATAIEHSHWSSHGASRAALDDDDGRAILVDHTPLTRSVNTTFGRPAPAVVVLLTLPAPPATFIAVDRQTSGNSPRDGPPRGISLLRAPPSFDTL